MKAPVDRNRRKLLRLYSALDATGRETLLAFAEFLHARREDRAPTAPPIAHPVAIARPAEESVIAAIKRLSATYPMLEKDAMLHEVSGLMAQHVMQGRAAREVIDELERIFRERFEALSGTASPGSDRG